MYFHALQMLLLGHCNKIYTYKTYKISQNPENYNYFVFVFCVLYIAMKWTTHLRRA